MTVTNITSYGQFQGIINSGSPAVIDFSTGACGPCNLILPFFDQLSEEYTNIHFYKGDVDEQPQIAHACGIGAVPTFITFRNGKRIRETIDFDDPAKLEDLIKSLNASYVEREVLL